MPRKASVLWLVAVGALVLSALPGAVVANAAPVQGLYSDGIDALDPGESQTTCSPSAKPGVVDFRDMVLEAFPTTGDYGISRDCSVGGTSEHKEGRAWDWRVSAYTQHEIADEMLDWLLASDHYGSSTAMFRRFGIMYMIFDQQVWSAARADEGWRDYNGANPHTDHVHFSFAWSGAWETTTWWTAADNGQLLDASGITVARRGDKRVDAFSRGLAGQLLHRVHRAGAWSAWTDLGGVIDTAPAAVWRGKSKLEVVARGVNGLLYQRRMVDDVWGPWTSLDTSISAAPGIASLGKRVDVVVVDVLGVLQSAKVAGDGRIGAWQPLSGESSGAPAPVRTKRGLELFVTGIDGQVWYALRSSGVWSGWTALGGDATSAPGAWVRSNDRRVGLVVRGTDGKAWSRERRADTWGTWVDLDGFLVSAPDAEVGKRKGYSVVVRGLNGSMYEQKVPSAGPEGWVQW